MRLSTEPVSGGDSPLRFLREEDYLKVENYYERIADPDPDVREAARCEAVSRLYSVKTIGGFLDAVAQMYGDTPAMTDVRNVGQQDDDPSSMTFHSFHAWIMQEEAEMQHAGIGAGRRIGFIGENTPGVYAAMLASLHTGATAVPYASRTESGMSPAEAMERGEVDMVYVTSAALQVTRQADPSSRLGSLRDQGFIRGCDKEAREFLQEFPRGSLPVQPVAGREIGPDDTAVMMFTSGTTGKPAIEQISHSAILHPVLTIPGVYNDEPGTRTLQAMPFYHIYGLVTTLSALAAGSHVHITDGQSMKKNGAGIIKAVRPKFFPLVPYGWKNLASKIQAGLETKEKQGGVIGKVVSWMREAIAQEMRSIATQDLALSQRLGMDEEHLERARQYWHPVLKDSSAAPHGIGHAIRMAIGKALLPRILREAGLEGLSFGEGLATTGGARISAETIAFLRAIGMDLRPGYGATQHPIISVPQRASLEPLTCAGVPLPGVAMDLERNPEGGPSELVVMGPGVAAGNGLSGSEHRHALFHTRDTGSIVSPRGNVLQTQNREFVSVGQRMGRTLKLGHGFFVNLTAFEEEILTLPCIEQAMVFAPQNGNAKTGDLGALVILRETADNPSSGMSEEVLLRAIQDATTEIAIRSRAQISRVRIIRAPAGRDSAGGESLFTTKNTPKLDAFERAYSAGIASVFTEVAAA